MSLSTVAPLGNLQSRVHLPGILRIKLNEGTGYGGSICMGDLLGDTGGGAPLLGALKVMKGRLWGQASLFIWVQLGNLEWARLPGTLGDG